MRKGYQDTDRAPRAAVVTKLKGAAVAGAARRLWDAADYARPPQVRPGPRAGTGWQKLREEPLGKEQAMLTLYITKPKKKKKTFVVRAAECEGASPPLKLPPCFLGRKRDFSGDQFHRHGTASPGHLS